MDIVGAVAISFFSSSNVTMCGGDAPCVPTWLSVLARPAKHQPFSAVNWCSNFVVVVRSERVKSGTLGSNPNRCNCFRNIVVSTIFRTAQKSCQVYESAALTAELRAPREVMP